MSEIQPIAIERFNRVVVLTGAGASAASGLPTFRGPDGLWQPEVAWLSDARNLPASLPELWRFFCTRRADVLRARPNAAHLALAALEKRLSPGQSLTLVTQNVDGLHQKAGSREVAELHGSLFRSRCSSPQCSLPPFLDQSVEEQAPSCPLCGSLLRPDIVLFGEQLPVEAEWRVKKALRDCDLFLAVGTSGSVAPTSNFVRGAANAGARTL